MQICTYSGCKAEALPNRKRCEYHREYMRKLSRGWKRKLGRVAKCVERASEIEERIRVLALQAVFHVPLHYRSTANLD
jgi:hypothetical protein